MKPIDFGNPRDKKAFQKQEEVRLRMEKRQQELSSKKKITDKENTSSMSRAARGERASKRGFFPDFEVKAAAAPVEGAEPQPSKSAVAAAPEPAAVFRPSGASAAPAAAFPAVEIVEAPKAKPRAQPPAVEATAKAHKGIEIVVAKPRSQPPAPAPVASTAKTPKGMQIFAAPPKPRAAAAPEEALKDSFFPSPSPAAQAPSARAAPTPFSAAMRRAAPARTAMTPAVPTTTTTTMTTTKTTKTRTASTFRPTSFSISATPSSSSSRAAAPGSAAMRGLRTPSGGGGGALQSAPTPRTPRAPLDAATGERHAHALLAWAAFELSAARLGGAEGGFALPDRAVEALRALWRPAAPKWAEFETKGAVSAMAREALVERVCAAYRRPWLAAALAVVAPETATWTTVDQDKKSEGGKGAPTRARKAQVRRALRALALRRGSLAPLAGVVWLLDAAWRAVSEADARAARGGCPALFSAAAERDGVTSRDLLVAVVGDFAGVERSLREMGVGVVCARARDAGADDADGELLRPRGLRSGVRLARLYERLTGEPCLALLDRSWEDRDDDDDDDDEDVVVVDNDGQSEKRAVFARNMEMVLRCMKRHPRWTGSFPSSLLRDVRHQASLLWKMAECFLLPRLLDRRFLRAEARRLRALPGAAAGGGDADGVLFVRKPELDELLAWAAAAAAAGSGGAVRVRNLTSSWADGVALTHLLRFYLPGALAAPARAEEATRSPEAAGFEEPRPGVMVFDVASAPAGGAKEPPPAARRELASGAEAAAVMRNLRALEDALLFHAPQVPRALLSAFAPGSPPDERGVVLLLAYIARHVPQAAADFEAATLIQRAFRGFAQRRERRERRTAAGVIAQAIVAYRTHRRRRAEALGTLLEAFGALLAMHKARGALETRRRAAAVLQRALTARRDRRQRFLQRKTAATVLQAAWRALRQRRHFAALRRGARVVEARRRALVEGREARDRFLQCKRGAVAAQAAWRGAQERRRFAARRAAATRLQAVARAWRVRRHFMQCKKAVACIEERRLATLRMREARRRFVAQRAAAARRRFLQCKAAAACLGERRVATLRMREQRVRFLQSKAAATALQSAWRAFVARREFLRVVDAARTLQRAFRDRALRRRAAALKAAAAVVAARRRALLETREARRHFLQCKKGAVAVQAAWRALRQRRHFAALRRGARVVEARRRALVEGREARDRFLRCKSGAVAVQAAWRGGQARRRFVAQRAAAARLQAAFRGLMARRRFLQRKAAVACLGERRRAVLLQRSATAAFVAQRAAAARLQRVARGWMARRRARRERAARALQAAFRGLSARRRRREARATAVIGACVAAFVEKRRTARRERAATRLQAVARGRAGRKEARRERAAACLQAAYRGGMARKEAVRRRQQRREAAAAARLQAAARGFAGRKRFLRQRAAATTLQAALRLWSTQRRLRRAARRLHEERAATRIQACLRGRRVRRRLLEGALPFSSSSSSSSSEAMEIDGVDFSELDVKELRATAWRCAEAAQRRRERPETALGVRVSAAKARLLVGGARALEALRGAEELQAATTHSEVCCWRVLEDAGLAQLLGMVEGLQASRAHLPLLQRLMRVVRNIARFEGPRRYLAIEARGVARLLDFMQFGRANLVLYLHSAHVLKWVLRGALDGAAEERVDLRAALRDLRALERARELKEIFTQQRDLEAVQYRLRRKEIAEEDVKQHIKTKIRALHECIEGTQELIDNLEHFA